MRILLDGMGGDHAPRETVKGAVQAAELIDDEIVIIGRRDAIEKELKRNRYKGDQISIRDASDEITMHDSPVKAIRQKKDSSLVVGLNMIKDGEGDVFLSAGNTGALIVGARLILGRIRGIDRPALASFYPDMVNKKLCLLVDAGASAESKAQNLLEYGLMGSIFMEKALGVFNPRVGLVNLGAEESKGTSVTKDAYQRLKNSNLNFVGNVEAREVPNGTCDVIVCDGFVGNVILKLTEGASQSIFRLVKQAITENLKTKVGGALIKGQLMKLKDDFDYEEYGAAPVLGVNGAVMKMHGSSSATAVKNGIIRSVSFASGNVVDLIRQEMMNLDVVDEDFD